MRDFLSVDDVSGSELRALIEAGSAAKRDPISWSSRLLGKRIALIFEKPSTRTRVSFEAAVTSMGGHAIVLHGDELQLGRGETIEDTGRALSRYVDAIVLRTSAQERLERLADAAPAPVINALSDVEHPCQAVADLQTIQEKRGELKGVIVAYVGDGNNVAHSLMLSCALMGVHLRVAAPRGYEPFPAVVQRTSELSAGSGASVEVGNDPRAAAHGAHVLYTDVWTSMGQEASDDDRRRALEPYRIDGELLSVASRDAIVMHCLPAHRGEEIEADVLDGPRSVIWDQAENRMHSQKALLDWLLNAM